MKPIFLNKLRLRLIVIFIILLAAFIIHSCKKDNSTNQAATTNNTVIVNLAKQWYGATYPITEAITILLYKASLRVRRHGVKPLYLIGITPIHIKLTA